MTGAFTVRNMVTIALLAALVLLPVYVELGGNRFLITLFTRIVILALAAVSLNLIIGYGGMMSFGHAAFFGVGAYTVALLMKKAGFPLYLALATAPLAAGLAAAVIGWFCVRLIGLYFAILTLAFSQLLYMIVFQWYTFTGGDDGIHGIPRPEFLHPINYYLFCLLIFLACFLLIRVIVNSSFGLTIRAIRENMERATFIGINVRRYQWLNFIIAGAIAGLAGGLFTELNRFAQTEFLHWSRSAEPILASLVGGMYSLVGPPVGSAVLMFLKIILQQAHPGLVETWAIILGLILLAVVLFAPGGLVGLVQRALGRSET